MNAGFKTYLKISAKGFLLSLIFPFVLYFFVEVKSFVYISIIFNILGFVPGYYRYQDQLLFQKKLKAKGLTPEDLNNIAFVKSWDEIRKRGIIKYSLIDGGIFCGFALCGLFSLAALLVIKNMFTYIAADLSNMFNFIGYTYLAGATTGIIIYRILWAHNEIKFIRLTDPLH